MIITMKDSSLCFDAWTMKDILFSILIWRIKYFERSQSKIIIVRILNSIRNSKIGK